MMRLRVMSSMAAVGLLVITMMLLMVSKSYEPVLHSRNEVMRQAIESTRETEASGAPGQQNSPVELAPNDLLSQKLQTIPQDVNVNLNRATPGPNYVLLLSSTPRGGSTFIGELISTYESTVYFFEPLHKIRDDPCVEDAECLSPYLAEKFTCTFNDEYLEWLRSKSLFAEFFSNTTQACRILESKAKKSCLLKVDFKKECLESSTRLIKVIRARVSKVLPLLEVIPNLKIIHLYRDPRGFMKSIKKFKNWNTNSSWYCEGLEQDWRMSNAIMEGNLYPQQLMQLSYEDFSRDPVAGTRSLFNFLFGSPVLGASTLSYLERHTKLEKVGPMSTQKNSEAAAEAWRYSISEELLREIENNPQCRTCIQLMNHRLFDSLNNARDKNISLYLSGR